jgi:membrane protease YdiL (CAAX protease family)
MQLTLVRTAKLSIPLLVFLTAAGSALVLVLMGMAAAEPVSDIARPKSEANLNRLDLALVLSFAAYTAFGLAVLALARFHGGSAWRDLLAWHPYRLSSRFWAIVGATLLYSVAADSLLRHVHPQAESWFSVPEDGLRASAMLVLAVVFAPVVEELIFRGYFYSVLRNNFGQAAALIVSSAIFAALHYEGTHLYALVVFPVGIALGLMREVTGSIKPSIGFHAFNNLIAFLFSSAAFIFRP